MTLRTYLGTAPGVGKTYAMLKEGRRRAQKGEHVVVGWLERHGRAETRAQLGDLEVVPPAAVDYRGHTFPDLDVAAVLATGAGVVLVDELAHTTADGSRQRWQDVADLLAAGRDVLTTANVANLRSLRDVAAQLTGSGPGRVRARRVRPCRRGRAGRHAGRVAPPPHRLRQGLHRGPDRRGARRVFPRCPTSRR